MRKSSRLVSVVFSYLAVIVGLFALPTMGQSQVTYPVLNWIPPNSFPAGTTVDSLNTAGLLVPGTKASGTIPMWLCSITATTPHPLCSADSFAMVGKDPSAKGSAGIQIDVRIVPIRFTSASASLTFDPENNDSCSPNRTPALNMVQQSPLFKSGIWSPYLKPVGAGQLISVFQRANFSTYTQPKALNPSYEVTITSTLANSQVTPKRTIAIIGAIPAPPATNPPNLTMLPYTINGVVQTDSHWCDPLAIIDVNELDTLLQTQIIPALKNESGITPTTVPIFLFSNVAMSYTVIDTSVTPNTATTYCCILGYHNAYLSVTTGATANKLQTYIVANYDTTSGSNFPGAFPNGKDLVALANMIAGWMNNPTTLNTTLPWLGTINGSSGPQDTLEVAYPPALEPPLLPLYTITMPNKTVYHVQDLAFKSWFYCDAGANNSGFGGTYSLFNNLTLIAKTPACPP